MSLRSILEDKKIPKVFFDVRQDSGALHGQYQIELGGVIDLQILAMAAFRSSSTHLWNLQKSILYWSDLQNDERKTWKDKKHIGHTITGRDYSKWLERPLPQGLLKYATNDTVYMPLVYGACMKKVSEYSYLMRMIETETSSRIQDSQLVEHPTTSYYAPSALVWLLDFEPVHVG